MKIHLEPAKAVLHTFLTDLEEVNNIRKHLSASQMVTAFSVDDQMPCMDTTSFTPAPDSFWEKENAYIWLYADPWNYHSMMHRPKPNLVDEYYEQPAWPLYEQWQREEKELHYRKCEKIPVPAQGVSLADYLQQLALAVSEGNEHRDVWIESLRSFLQFLREDTELDQKGSLEILFPSKESCKGMELRKGYSPKLVGDDIENIPHNSILRRIEDTVYPISDSR